MAGNFISSLNAVLAVFLIIAAGYATRRLLKLDKQTTKKFNKVVFYCLMPVMLFSNVYSADFRGMLTAKFSLYIVFGLIGAMVIAWLLVGFFEKETSKKTVIIQAAFRGNYLILGLPLMQQLFPGEDMTLVSSLVIIVTPLYNGLATVLFETYRDKKVNVGRILVGVIKNPLVIGMGLGVICNLLAVNLPVFLSSPIKSIGGTASTIALLVLGMQFEFGSLNNQKKDLLVIIFARLLIVPAVGLSLAACLGFRGLEFGSLIPIFGSPVAVASYTMAAEMGGDADLAANGVAVTTALSVFTLFGWIFLFKTLGVI